LTGGVELELQVANHYIIMWSLQSYGTNPNSSSSHKHGFQRSTAKSYTRTKELHLKYFKLAAITYRDSYRGQGKCLLFMNSSVRPEELDVSGFIDLGRVILLLLKLVWRG